MKKVYSVKDIDDLHRSSALGSIPADAVITPSARDRLNELGVQRARRTAAAPASASSAGGGSVDERGIDQSVRANSSKADLERLFNSPAVHELKEQICDVGRRLWQRAYVDGNGGNLSIRLTEDVVLCTPTLVSKGFMKPEDLCLVDLDGNQLAGVKNRTSEILMHLSIMKAQPKARPSERDLQQSLASSSQSQGRGFEAYRPPQRRDPTPRSVPGFAGPAGVSKPPPDIIIEHNQTRAAVIAKNNMIVEFRDQVILVEQHLELLKMIQ